MPVKDFEVTKGLLEDDMRKQAGTIEKSWLEAVMNAVDAGASEVRVDFGEDHTVITDDGSGMTEDEIELYFKQFGYKDDDVEDKTFGRFRRGRGQIFNFGVNIWHTQDNLLVVNLDGDETTIPAETPVGDHDEDVEKLSDGNYTFKTHGLGFNQQPASEKREGTRIEVIHFNRIDDVDEKEEQFKKLCRYVPVLHDIEVIVNGKKVDERFEPDFTTEYGMFQYGTSSMFPDAAVYNLGAYVSDFKITDSNGDRVPVAGVIISKRELDLNNARNDIIEGDETWEQVKEDYIEGAKYTIAQRDDIGSKEIKWLIKQAADDPGILDRIMDRPLIEDIEGNKITLSEMQERQTAFAPSGNAVAKEAMDRENILMVNESFAESINHLAESVSDGREMDAPSSYEDVVDNKMQFEMKERDESNLSKRRKKNLRIIRWMLREIDCYDDVKPGYSKHENVWKDDEHTLFVDENFLNANKSKMATEVFDRVIEIAAADQDTRKELQKSGTYYRNYHRLMNKSTEARKDVMSGNVDFSNHPALM